MVRSWQRVLVWASLALLAIGSVPASATHLGGSASGELSGEASLGDETASVEGETDVELSEEGDAEAGAGLGWAAGDGVNGSLEAGTNASEDLWAESGAMLNGTTRGVLGIYGNLSSTAGEHVDLNASVNASNRSAEAGLGAGPLDLETGTSADEGAQAGTEVGIEDDEDEGFLANVFGTIGGWFGLGGDEDEETEDHEREHATQRSSRSAPGSGHHHHHVHHHHHIHHHHEGGDETTTRSSGQSTQEEQSSGQDPSPLPGEADADADIDAGVDVEAEVGANVSGQAEAEEEASVFAKIGGFLKGTLGLGAALAPGST